MFNADGFNQVAPRFPERVAVQLPKGMRSAIRRAAERERVTPAEFMRRVLAETVREVAAPTSSNLGA